MAVLAPMSGVVYPMQNGTTTGNGDIMAPPPSFIHHNFIITTAAGVLAGAITLETSNDPNYAGTWALITTTTPATPITVVAGAAQLVEYEGRLNFVRARISTTISGGGSPSVKVEYQGGKNY